MGRLVSSANRGLGLARGKIVSRIDDDVVLSPGWAAAVVSTFEADRTVGVSVRRSFLKVPGRQGPDIFQSTNKRGKRGLWRILRGFITGSSWRGAVSGEQFFRSGAFSLGSNFKSRRPSQARFRSITSKRAICRCGAIWSNKSEV